MEYDKHDHIFVGGRWIPAHGPCDIDVIAPATEQVIATVSRCDDVDVDAAVSAARGAFDEWSRSSLEDRSMYFEKMASLLESQIDDVTDTISTEVGHPRKHARVAQVIGAVDELRMIAKDLHDIAWEEQRGGATVRRVPAGVVAAITAWNAPLRSIVSKAGAAMAAGCTVVVKVSEVAPLSGYIFAEIVRQSGVPAGVFNFLVGTGPEVGEALVLHPDVDMVSLTGSVGAGSRVMELAARGVKRVHLELGGKSAHIIMGDAPLEEAIGVTVEDAFRNAGQVCGSLSRVLVPRERLAEAEELLARKAESFVIGDPFAEETTLGPVKTARQRDRVRSMIEDAVASGEARLVTGGAEQPEHLEDGYFIRPTVFSTTNDSRIAREEVFGPVISVIPFEDVDDAIRIANDSPYGLAGGVWAGDPADARAVATRIRTGRVRINGKPLDKNAPHGGFKLSGIGREWGRYGIEEFLEYQSLMG
ncbi:aldehyde dehydrogenase family protein [Microbacterium gorillae]|uniref:aldehyde dehydrogenase family protein n=1 Tax=Microbacterium gorillae TaxID=1231063 RepID=UPI00058B4150|nr:aldehyde dehydrogenase family protein [Microbacterium gorillae]